VGIGFQCWLGLEQAPCLLIRFRPVLAENAGANLSALCQFVQAFLHGDADVATGAGRAVAVNQFEQRRFFLSSEGELTLEALQGLVDLRHIGFEIYSFDRWSRAFVSLGEAQISFMVFVPREYSRVGFVARG